MNRLNGGSYAPAAFFFCNAASNPFIPLKRCNSTQLAAEPYDMFDRKRHPRCSLSRARRLRRGRAAIVDHTLHIGLLSFGGVASFQSRAFSLWRRRFAPSFFTGSLPLAGMGEESSVARTNDVEPVSAQALFHQQLSLALCRTET